MARSVNKCTLSIVGNAVLQHKKLKENKKCLSGFGLQ